MTEFADRVHRVKPSFTLEMTSRAADLRAQGVDVINFGVGQPDFNTPENIRQAAKIAMDDMVKQNTRQDREPLNYGKQFAQN